MVLNFKMVILKWLINKALYSVEDYFKIAVYDLDFQWLINKDLYSVKECFNIVAYDLEFQ